jgi:diguanylate cyclase
MILLDLVSTQRDDTHRDQPSNGSEASKPPISASRHIKLLTSKLGLPYMTTVYNHGLVALSIIVAILASYTALRLAARVAANEGRGARIWVGIGATAMGIGIWSMHFIGMLAFSLPIQLAYDIPTTLASLAVAIITSGFALAITSGRRLTTARLGGSAVAMGIGISMMHYMGMGAITIAPAISYDPLLVAASILIAVSASFVALWLFFRLREDLARHQRLARIAAAVIMGLAISGMHYTAMAASRFASGSFCRSGVTFQSGWLAAVVGVFALGLLAMTLVAALYDARLQSRARAQALRLEKAHADLQYQATHDALTGLPNRVLFLDRLGREIAQAQREGRTFAVLVVDLDRFKVINDTLGHGPGDQLLVEIARRLSLAIRAVDTVARMGGNEFLMLITGIREPADAGVIAGKIVSVLDQSVIIGATEVHTSASVGISVYPADGTGSESLVAHANEAMYFAKQSGRNRFQFFSAEMSVFSRERLDLERDLRHALSLDQFEVHYQPKIDIASGHMNSVEALLRWRHPTRGLVAPNDFIPLAEESGLMFGIGEWVLREACRQARQWQDEGLPFLRIAVNISPMHFPQPNFLGVVRAALSDHHVEPRYLEIELTEATVMDHAESSIQILEELSRMGVLVSIDDFGTGYSSMSYLRRFPIDKLKIDRSFIKDLTTNSDAAAIVKAIISLAHSLRLKVVAEGVETAAQLEQLREFGCDQFQGFYHSRAMLPGKIKEFLPATEGPKLMDQRMFMETQSKLAAFKRA